MSTWSFDQVGQNVGSADWGWRAKLATAATARGCSGRVVDVGCGTGLSFSLLEGGIGHRGHLIGVDLTPEMLAKARDRAGSFGWENVTLIEAPAEEARLPVEVDAVLFCLGHDIISSPQALANILDQVRPGGRVAAGGTEWAPWWAVPVNIAVWRIAHAWITRGRGSAGPRAT